MKVTVTVENLETGEKDSVIGDGAMAYVKVGNKDHVLALGKYNSMEAVSNIAYAAVHSASKRCLNGTAEAYEDIINRLKEDARIATRSKSSAMTPQEIEKKSTDAINAVMTPQELEKKLIDAIRSALKDEGEKE